MQNTIIPINLDILYLNATEQISFTNKQTYNMISLSKTRSYVKSYSFKCNLVILINVNSVIAMKIRCYDQTRRPSDQNHMRAVDN